MRGDAASAPSVGAMRSFSAVSPVLRRSVVRRRLLQASPQPQVLHAAALAPRPATAKAARALATQSLADAIAADTSQYALCPGDPDRARAIVQRVRSTKADARALSTQRGDNWGYQWYLNGCDDLGCDPIRPKGVLDAPREAVLGGHVVMNAAAKMKPRDRTRDAADPSSAWAAYKKARAVLSDLGCLLPPLDDVREVLRGLLRDFVRRFGDMVLVTSKKQPYHRSHECALEHALLRQSVEGFSHGWHFMMWVAVCFLRNIGARGAELCKGDLYFTRRNISPMIGNAVLEPTLDSFQRATRIRVTPTGSKCDFTNKHWGAHPMYFDVVAGDHLNLGYALQQLECTYVCPPHLRDEYPVVFNADAACGGVPAAITKSWLDRQHSSLLQAVLGVETAASRTIHSWRITLGCSLRAAKDDKHPDGRPLELVKAFGRWRSDAAVAGYARLSADAYAAHIRASLAADAGSVPAPSLDAVMRAVDPIDMIESVQLAIDDTATRSTARAAPSTAAAAFGGRDAAAVARIRAQLAPRKRVASRSATPATAPRRCKTKRSRTAAVAAPPCTPPPLSAANAKGRRVLVPASLWPDYTCHEHGGRGWDAVVHSVKRGAATVRFSTLRHDDGSRDKSAYYLDVSALEPL